MLLRFLKGHLKKDYWIMTDIIVAFTSGGLLRSDLHRSGAAGSGQEGEEQGATGWRHGTNC